MTRASRKAQKKMQCALESANSTKILAGGSSSLSRQGLEQNKCKTSLKDHEVASKNLDQRCTFLTVVTLGPDSCWIPLLSLEGPDQQNDSDSADVNLEKILLICPTRLISFQVDAQRAQNSHILDHPSSENLLTNGVFGSNVLKQSHSGLRSRKAKLSKDSGSSSQQNSVVSSSSCTSIQDEFDPTWLVDEVKDKPSTERPIKGSSRKKTKKKKPRKKSLQRTKRPEALCEEYVHETAVVCEEKSISSIKLSEIDMQLKVSLSMVDRYDGDDYNNCVANDGSGHMMASPSNDVVQAPETIVPSEPLDFECESYITGCATETGEVLSDFKGEVADIGKNQGNCSDCISCEDFSDEHVGGDSEEQQTGNQDCGINSAKHYGGDSSCYSLDGPEKDYFPPGHLSKGLIYADSFVETTNCSILDSSSSELHLFEPVKRGRKGRKLFGTSSCAHRFSYDGHAHGYSGEENNISAPQKYQRNNVDYRIFEPDNAYSVGSRYDILSKEVHVSLKSEGEDKSTHKVSEKRKRKPRVRSRQENINNRKGPCGGDANSKKVMKVDMQQEELLEATSQVNLCKCFLQGSSSYHHADCSRLQLGQTSRVDSSSSKSVRDLRACIDETNTVGSAFTKSCANMVNQASQNQITLPLDQRQLRNEQREDHGVGNGPVNSKAQVDVKQDHNSGFVLKKWVTVVTKDVAMADSTGPNNLLMSDPYESVTDGWSLKNTENLELNPVPPVDALDGSSGTSTEDVNSLPSDDERHVQRLRYGDACVSKETSKIVAETSSFLIPELKNHTDSSCLIDLYKIVQATKEAYRLQSVSESVQKVVGSPVADFERLLHSASPVLCQTRSLLKCQSCSKDQFKDASLCRHEIPNISLGSLWQWYETQGICGLEVTAQDPRKKGTRKFEFSAYFVPYLSAIQLFGSSRRHSCNASSGVLSEAVSTAHDVTGATEKSSSPSLNSTCVGDPKLIFEYFELEQPPQRRVLFEKIKELVRGEAPLSGQAYGDPTKLDSLDLLDLHPASWYCVAWYPIYRIPDRSFRAAFLTYHSLGHLIRRSVQPDRFESDTCIVSPVVGLQSYNAQGECWFKFRHSMKSFANENPSASLEILKERLRTLEQTASVMARSAVKKENVKSVNWHPDYEFFISRQPFRFDP